MDEAKALAGTSTVTTRLLLRVVAARGGEGTVERVLDRAGLADQRTSLQSLGGRVSYPEKLRLFDAAAEELGDPRIGPALGRAAMSDPAVVALRRVLTTFGTPACALTHAGSWITRSSSRRGWASSSWTPRRVTGVVLSCGGVRTTGMVRRVGRPSINPSARVPADW